jgi:hypothetical protein
MDLSLVNKENLVFHVVHPPFYRPRSGGYIGTQGPTGGPTAEKIMYHIWSNTCWYNVIMSRATPTTPSLAEPATQRAVYCLLPSYRVVASTGSLHAGGLSGGLNCSA